MISGGWRLGGCGQWQWGRLNQIEQGKPNRAARRVGGAAVSGKSREEVAVGGGDRRRWCSTPVAASRPANKRDAEQRGESRAQERERKTMQGIGFREI